MKYIVSIFQVINRNWTSRMFTLVLILLGTYSATTIFKAKATTVKADCTPYQEQVKILSQTLEQVSRAVDVLSGAHTTSAVSPNLGEISSNLVFAVYRDTIKPVTTQQILKELRKKIDSAKWKVDSINKQQKQIPQSKT